jgi:hypothetical protein
MRWFKPHPEKPVREQLLEARENLRRQVDFLNSGPSYPDLSGSYMRQQADELNAMIDEIDAELARTDVKTSN